MAKRIDFGRWDVEDWTPSDSNREIPSDLQDLFIGDEQWPLSAASLAALIDLGMTDQRIAEYFGVETHRVAALRFYYGFGNAAP